MANHGDAKAALEQLRAIAEEGPLKATIRALQRKNEQLQRQLVEQRPQPVHTEPRTHLVIGDPHCDPLWDNSRFRQLGRVIADLEPEVVICMGDFATLGSLGRFDRGKLKGEGQRLVRDIDHCRDALWQIREGLGGFRPDEMWMLEGNHEHRISAYTDDRPELAGTYSSASLGFEEFGWRFSPFLTELIVDDITYVHYASTSGGRAVSAKFLGSNVLSRYMKSTVVGHSHRFDLHVNHEARKFGLSAGCYFEHDEDYASPYQNRDWWRGLVVVHDVVRGFGRVEQLPLDHIQGRY